MLFSPKRPASGLSAVYGDLIVGAAGQNVIAIALTNVLIIDVVQHALPAMILIGLAALVFRLLGSVPPVVRAARINIVEAVTVD